jgi:hypothetical protein
MAMMWNFRTQGMSSSTAAVHIPYENPGNILISGGTLFRGFRQPLQQNTTTKTCIWSRRTKRVALEDA